MAYIGVSPSNGVRRKHTYTATAAQTSFSGAGAEGITLGYLDSNYVDVYQNGVKLSEADYTSTSGTAIVLATGATASDMIEVVVYDVFSVADTVSKSAGGTFDGNITAAGTLAVTGVVTANAGVVVDEMTLDGDTLTATDTFTIDAVEDITLDAASTLVRIKHNGTQRFIFNTDATPEIDALGGNFTLHANTSDADIIFNGNDGGAAITALTLDMSAGGNAIFNNSIAVADGDASAPGFRFKDDLNNGMFRAGTDIIGLSTAGTERMRILATGQVLCNTTASLGNGTVHIDAASNIYCLVARANGTNGAFVLFQKDDGDTIGSIDHTASATRYLTSSDYRLKENVVTSWDATTRLKQLKPSRFNFIADADTTVDGFLAHEVSSIVPEAISGEKDAVDADGNAVMQGIDQSKLVPLLVKTIQELEARITTLENA